jgi:hypothetical protein
MKNEFGGPSLKHSYPNIKSLGGVYAIVDEFLASQQFKEIMYALTGIDDLIYDPNYYGGGTHNNLSGQGMDPHVDFNVLNILPFGDLH